MMRKGPLADYPIESLLEEAADERANGVIELRTVAEGRVYLVEGEVYFADLFDQAPLEQLLLEAGLLTQEQIDRHTEPGAEGPYLALALDTDPSIDEHEIADWLLDRTAATLARFVGVREGEYELDPYATHPIGILASWRPPVVLQRSQEIRAEAEQRARAERAEAERAEAARRAELERREAEQRADAERAAAQAAAGESAAEGATPVAEAPESAVAEGPPADLADLPPPPAAPTGEPAATPADPEVLVVTADAAPAGMDPIELSPIEWRVVVMAARGVSLEDLAKRLHMDIDEVTRVAASLSARGLLATVG